MVCSLQKIVLSIFLCTSTLVSYADSVDGIKGLPEEENKDLQLVSCVKGNYEVCISQADLGGGGYITGMIQDIKKPGVLYARSDVAGVFKTTNGGKSWKPVNGGLTLMSDHYCHSLAIDPYDSQCLLRASGDVRNFRFTGRLHRTEDGGKHWTLVKDGLDYYGNGNTRQFGELICYNPLKKGEVYAGSLSKGLWKSSDGGQTWECKGLKGERIISVNSCNNNVYVTTCSDEGLYETTDSVELEQKIKSAQDFHRNKSSKIYVSEDGGNHWNIIFENKNLGIFEAVILDQGMTILFTSRQGIYRSTNGGKSFEKVTAIPTKSHYRTLIKSPHNETIYASEEFSTINPIAIYVSHDKGETWSAISHNVQPENLFEFPAWHTQKPSQITAAVSHLLVDIQNPQKLYICNWWGVTITYDHGKNFYGHDFKGLGILCSETLVKHPTRQEVLVLGTCDHKPALSVDYGLSYDMIPPTGGPARAIAFSRFKSNLMLYAAETKLKQCYLYYSEDLGKSSRVVWTLHGKNFIQAIKEDPIVEGRFWALVEGDTRQPKPGEISAGIYVSTNFGKNWEKVKNPCWGDIATIPAEEFYVDANLTPIVNYQYKNGAGTGQLLTLDAIQKDVLYVGEWTEGIYRSSDAGTTWKKISRTLPFDVQQNQILSLIYADPQKTGVIYSGFWNGGLWKSTDYGNSWHKVNLDNKQIAYNVTSMDIDRNDKGESIIVVACSNHLLGDTPTKIFVSDDEGKSWIDVYDKALGSLRIMGVQADVDLQRLHVASDGNGLFYFDLNKRK